jgi:hypothetical protein
MSFRHRAKRRHSADDRDVRRVLVNGHEAMRRLRAMGVFAAEIGEGIRARDARRPRIAREIFKPVVANRRKSSDVDANAIAAVLGVLTSFETHDALSTAGQSDRQIVTTLTRLAVYIAGMHRDRRDPQ